MALGVGEGEEFLEFLVRLENVSGEVVERLDRPGVLSRQQFSGRQARPGWRTCRAVCAGCAHRTSAGWSSWPVSSISATASSHSVRPDLPLVNARRVALVGTCGPEAERRRGVRIRLAIEDHLFSGAFQPKLGQAIRHGPPGHLADQLLIDRIHQVTIRDWQGCPGCHPISGLRRPGCSSPTRSLLSLVLPPLGGPPVRPVRKLHRCIYRPNELRARREVCRATWSYYAARCRVGVIAPTGSRWERRGGGLRRGGPAGRRRGRRQRRTWRPRCRASG